MNLNSLIAILAAAVLWTVSPAAARTTATPVLPVSAEETTCAECHAGAVKAWQGSHHAKAMQHASPETVLGAFSNVSLTHAGERTLLSRRGDRFLATISIVGSGNAAEQYEILYSFGIAPLQQYLVETEPGRLQALPWAWDTRAEAEGGARWFHLYEGDEVPPGDRLHWKNPLQNWNGMCADCHSTGLARNYDISIDRFQTTASSVNISCASCHGDGTDHALAMRPQEQPPSDTYRDIIRFLDAATSRFERAKGAATAANTGAPHEGREIEVCASCHSRRTPLTEKIDPALAFLDQFSPDLLDEGLYHADGQIEAEVYVWGSFMQSKMAAAGVTCTNCHDAHTLTLKREGNALCSTCHAPEVFDKPDHHRHAPGTKGSACASCHMPQTTYMGIDARRDHSFKIPRPDLSEDLGTPNACTICHTDMTDGAAARHVIDWYGPQKVPDPAAQTIAAARAGDPAARGPLRALIEDEARPAITRATALTLIPHVADQALISTAIENLKNNQPLIRIGSIRALTVLSPQQRAEILAPFLSDRVKAVRLEIATALRDVPANTFSDKDRPHFEAAISELLAANEEIAWRGEGGFARALIHQGQGNTKEAKEGYAGAIRIDPAFTPSYINLSELLRVEDRNDETLTTLLQGLAAAPDDGALEHALGLALVRAGKPEEAMPHLERAVTLSPQIPRFAYVHAVALHSAGKVAEARDRVEAALVRHPRDRNLLNLLQQIH